jgi:hypothetical protein
VAHLGFLDVNGTAPQAPGGSNLVVALRDRPTLAHFDPERVEHWTFTAGKGQLGEVTRRTPVPLEHPFAWGTIRVVDRLEVFNSFLTFGGTLHAVEWDATTTIAVFSSHAPILRSTGHSQGVDLSTGEVGAFFARMRIPINFIPGAEQRIGEAAPMTVYAGFHAATWARLESSEELRETQPAFAAWCHRERLRLASTFAADWAAGRALAHELRLDAV